MKKHRYFLGLLVPFGLAAAPMPFAPEESPFVNGPLKAGEREALLYVWTADVDQKQSDFIAVIDANPESGTYGQLVATAPAGSSGNEPHHFGYTADATRIFAAGMFSNRLFIYEIGDNPRAPRLIRTIDLEATTGHTGPHSVFAVPDGVLISMLGGKGGAAPGALVKFNPDGDFLGVVKDERASFMYDVAVKPELNLMLTSSWAHPHNIKAADSDPAHLGETVSIWDFKTGALRQVAKVDKVPLSVRPLYGSKERGGYVNCMGGNSIWYWEAKGGKVEFTRVVQLAEGTAPADIRVSFDDRYLFVTLFGGNAVQQYDIRDRLHPKLLSEVSVQQPNMLKLSADGRRLYATNSAFSFADGAAPYRLQLIDVTSDGLRLDRSFMVDFEKFPNGRSRPHDMLFH